MDFRRLLLVVVMALPIGFSATSATAEEGWEPLFNGENLDGWFTILKKHGKKNDPNGVIQAVDGMIHVYKDSPDCSDAAYGYFCTEDEYSDYHLRFQYK